MVGYRRFTDGRGEYWFGFATANIPIVGAADHWILGRTAYIASNICGPSQMRLDQEAAFLEVVKAFRSIGYGRMMQIISHQWYQEDRVGAQIVTSAVGLLDQDDRLAFAELVRQDPLFNRAVAGKME